MIPMAAFMFWFAQSMAVPLAQVPDYVEGEVLVSLKPASNLASLKQTSGRHSLEMAKHFQWLSQERQRQHGLLRSRTKTTAALIAELKADPEVETVEPNYLRWPNDMRVPNDPSFAQMWGLRNTGQTVNGTTGTAQADISFLAAWGMARASTGEVVIALVDTGLDYTHPDLASNLWTNAKETVFNGIDEDGNGYVDDVHGYNFADGNGDVMDSSDHGTHVGGIVAATGNNLQGVIGVNFQAHLMALKTSSDGTYFTTSVIIEAIQYATMMKNRGVNVVAINASYGGSSFSTTERAAMQAAGDAGIIFCAAAGNSTANNDATSYYPASYRLPNMIVVAASDQKNALTSFSSYGATTVDLAAPGQNILSALPLALVVTTGTVHQATATYVSRGMTYSGATTGITATIYNCGLGNPPEFPGGVSNNIALIQRGNLNFSTKVANAMAAGARAAIVYNNVAGSFNGTLQYASNWIPSICIAQADGQALLLTLPTTGSMSLIYNPSDLYQYLPGTSMATPHVAGAVAFAAMNFPQETVSQRIQRILTNVTVVPSLQGKTSTGGRLNLAKIIDTDSNGMPDWWEQMYFGHLTSTNMNVDADHDGASNWAEWIAGTNPTDPLDRLDLIPKTAPGTNAFTVQWPSVAGKYYRLLLSTNLASGFSDPVLTNIIATPPVNTITNLPMPNKTDGFYRVQVEP